MSGLEETPEPTSVSEWPLRHLFWANMVSPKSPVSIAISISVFEFVSASRSIFISISRFRPISTSISVV